MQARNSGNGIGVQTAVIDRVSTGELHAEIPEANTNEATAQIVAENEYRGGIDGQRNHGSHAVLQRYDRQSGLVRISAITIPPEIAIIGCGNIGSHCALTLARAGAPVLHLYDSDKVEIHNLASQSYGENMLGKFKAEAVAQQIHAINSDTIVYIHGNASIKKPTWARHKYVIIAVDTMSKRKQFSDVLSTYGNRYTRNVQAIVDIRCGGEQIDVFTAGQYQYRYTIRDNPSVDTCGARYVGYVSAIAGALGAKEVLREIHARELENESNNDIRSYSVDVRNMQVVRGV